MSVGWLIVGTKSFVVKKKLVMNKFSEEFVVELFVTI